MSYSEKVKDYETHNIEIKTTSNTKNPLLKGDQHALVITVLQVVSSEPNYSEYYVLLRVGSSYYEGEPFSLGFESTASSKTAILPTHSTASSIQISPPTIVTTHVDKLAGKDDTMTRRVDEKNQRERDTVLVSTTNKSAFFQSNANLQLCQKFIFWISLHSELFDYFHIDLFAKRQFWFSPKLIGRAALKLDRLHAHGDNFTMHLELLDAPTVDSLHLEPNPIPLDASSTKGLIGISVEFTSHGIAKFFSKQDTSMPVATYDSNTYPISAVRKKAKLFSQPMTAQGSLYLRFSFRGSFHCHTGQVDQTKHVSELLRPLYRQAGLQSNSGYSEPSGKRPPGPRPLEGSSHLFDPFTIQILCQTPIGRFGIFHSKLRTSSSTKFKELLSSNNEAIIKYLKIDPSHLLVNELVQSSVYKPAYLIFYDAESKSIVVSIRGSMSLFDAVTDLNCDYIEWKEGLLHAGFYTCANWMAENLLAQPSSPIFQYLRLFNTTDLVVCGHSMGAGVAAILGLLFNENAEKSKINARFFCFGSPSVISCHLLERSQRHQNIFTFNYGNDLVSHLSYGSMRDFCTLIMVASKHITKSFFYYLRPGTPLFEAAMEDIGEVVEFLQSSAEKRLTKRKFPPDAHNNIKLLPAGVYHHIFRQDAVKSDKTQEDTSSLASSQEDSAPQKLTEAEQQAFREMASQIPKDRSTKGAVMIRTDPRPYSHMLITSNCITHHLPVRYELAIDRAICRLAGNKGA